jgi:hypothetical protein
MRKINPRPSAALAGSLPGSRKDPQNHQLLAGSLRWRVLHLGDGISL